MAEKERLYLRLEVGLESEMLVKVGETPPPGTHTHRWTVFVRGPNDTPLDSQLISKIVFQLHEDFKDPKRTVSTPPYEVTETGYAGFTIPIFVHFVNCRREYYLEYDMNLLYETHVTKKETKTLEFKDPKSDLRSRLIKAGAEVVPVLKGKPLPSSSSTQQSFEDVFGKPITFTHSDKPRSAIKVTKAPSKPAPTTFSSSSTAIIKPKEIDNKLNSAAPLKNGASSDKHVACPPSTSVVNNAISGGVDKISTISRPPKSQDRPKDDTYGQQAKDKSTKKRTKNYDKNKEKPILSPFYANDAVASTSGLSTADNCSNTPPSIVEVSSSSSSMVKKIKVSLLDSNDDTKLLPPPKSKSPLFSTASPGSSPDRDDHRRNRTTTTKSFSSPFSSPQHRSQSLLDANCSPTRINKKANVGAESTSASKKRKKPKDSSSTLSNNNLLVKKRAKTKSDSGMDSDYSGTNNASPVEPPSSVENVATSLFSPDSARSVDTVLHESPASAGSAASTSSSNVNGASTSNSNHNCPNISSQSNQHILQNDAVATTSSSSPSTKPKSKNNNNNVEEPRLNSLMSLQRKIMTIREQSVAQKIADIIVSAQSYECTTDNFEFDLFKLDTNIINMLFKCLDSSPSSTSTSTASTTTPSAAATSGRCN